MISDNEIFTCTALEIFTKDVGLEKLLKECLCNINIIEHVNLDNDERVISNELYNIKELLMKKQK